MKILTNAKKWLPGALIVVMLCGMIGSTYAKYVKQQTLEGTVTIQANLGNIKLLEHKAVDPEGDGEYTLDQTQEVTENTYNLLPGLDIPKDPFVQITAKTPIKAYVFIEVVTNIVTDNKDMTTDTNTADDHNISYTPTSNWLQISKTTEDDVITTVYVYTVDGQTPAIVDETFDGYGTGTIQILEDNTIYVSQKLNVPTTGVYLYFSACMYEVASAERAEDDTDLTHAQKVYSKNNP